MFKAQTVFRISCVLILIITSGCGGVRSLIPTPNLYADEHQELFPALDQSLQKPTVEMLYITDRAPVTDEKGHLGYTYDRSSSVAFGRATINIGNDLSWEDLVEASEARKRVKSLNLTMGEVVEISRSPPSPIAFTLVDGEIVEDAAAVAVREEIVEKFHQAVAGRLERTSRKDVYLFVHGYHNSFEDGAFALTDLWHFLGREGVPIVYSWPAGYPGIFGYTYDRESSEFTVGHLKGSLQTLASFPEVERIHLISHSRGTGVAVAAVRELTLVLRASGRNPREALKLHNFVLAAPDIDVEVAEQRIMGEKIGLSAGRVTLYTSPADKALGIATTLFESPRGRIGRLGEKDLTEADKKFLTSSPTNTAIVNFSGGEADRFGHSYFRTNPSVSSDLILLLRYDEEAGSPSRPLVSNGLDFWEIPDGYPSTAVVP